MTANQNEIDSGTRISVENDWTDGLTSRLKIRRALSSDTGNYTCVPTIAKSSSVYAHVIIGSTATVTMRTFYALLWSSW
uniref:Ig-like domain-containing protein n=1 Tax=Glossina austeni TaxID=7395 RepID=A0A1A9VY69_GLOAU